MFEYEKYIDDLAKINEEEINSYNDKIEDIDEFEKPFIEKRDLLNKKYNIIFKHELKDAWEQPEEEFYIINSDKNNILITKHGRKYNYTIAKEDIDKIINDLSKDNILFKNCDVAFPSVLDGSSHKLYICDGEKNIAIDCSNLWYWFEEEISDDFNDAIHNKEETKEVIEYTRHLVEFIRKIQHILEKNSINYYILGSEEE